MLNRWMAAAATLVVAALTAMPAWCELSAGQKMGAEALIKQFSAPGFDDRQQAVDKLVALGADVVPLIRKTLDETADNEVKLRCRMVLKALGADTSAKTPAPAAGPGPGKFGFDASKVTIKVKDAQLDEILQALADQSGNARIELPKDWEGKALTLDVTDCSYWQALDKVCAQANLIYTMEDLMTRFMGGMGAAAAGEPAGVRLVSAKDTEDVGAYSGPVVVKAASATVTKRFRPTQMPMGQEGGLSLTLAWFYEDRLQPIETKAEVTKITTTDGRELALAEAQAVQPPARGGRGGIAVILRGMRDMNLGAAGTMVANVDAVPKNLDTLKTVEGVVKLTFGTGEKQFKIEDALAGNGKSATVGKETLTVTQVQRQRGGLTVSIKHTSDGKDVEMPAFGARSSWGIRLIDPNGAKHAPVGSGMFGGRGGVWAIAGGGGAVRGQGPGPGAIVGAANDDGVTAFFMNLPEVEGAWTLVYVVPETLTEKAYTFKLTDVPLR
jgi:hypothetical protein